MKTVDRTS